VLLELAKFVVGKSAVIMIRVLAAVINIDHFLWPQRHDRMQHHAVEERENCRVIANRQRKRQYRRCRESRRLEKLPQSKLEILDHENLGLFPLRCRPGPFWIQQVDADPEVRGQRSDHGLWTTDGRLITETPDVSRFTPLGIGHNSPLYDL